MVNYDQIALSFTVLNLSRLFCRQSFNTMEQHALKNVKNLWNISFSFYSETSVSQNSTLYCYILSKQSFDILPVSQTCRLSNVSKFCLLAGTTSSLCKALKLPRRPWNSYGYLTTRWAETHNFGENYIHQAENCPNFTGFEASHMRICKIPLSSVYFTKLINILWYCGVSSKICNFSRDVIL